MAKTASTKRGQLADRIARDIQSGTFAPGMWLKQIDLERRYGATRLEVRAALDRLAQRRLVRHLANRGYHVFQADGREATEILAIRCMLETGVADSIVHHATPAAIAELDALARRFEDLLPHGTLIELYGRIWRFTRRCFGSPAIGSSCVSSAICAAVPLQRRRANGVPTPASSSRRASTRKWSGPSPPATRRASGRSSICISGSLRGTSATTPPRWLAAQRSAPGYAPTLTLHQTASNESREIT
jgi:Bacterial regulatory proteins, gntR family